MVVKLSVQQCVKWEWLCVAGNVPTVSVARYKLRFVATVVDTLRSVVVVVKLSFQ